MPITAEPVLDQVSSGARYRLSQLSMFVFCWKEMEGALPVQKPGQRGHVLGPGWNVDSFRHFFIISLLHTHTHHRPHIHTTHTPHYITNTEGHRQIDTHTTYTKRHIYHTHIQRHTDRWTQSRDGKAQLIKQLSNCVGWESWPLVCMCVHVYMCGLAGHLSVSPQAPLSTLII